MNPPTPARTKRPAADWSPKISLLMVALVFLGLGWRQHRFVDRYAVNVMFWDQWDFYKPFFQHGNAWDIFDYQHGPHRQGAGFLVTYLLAGYSGWNSRWDAFGVSFILIGAGALAFGLARRCGVRPGLSLAAIPLLFFNFRQYEMFVTASNLSHGAMPMLLFMLFGLAWFSPSAGWRLALLSMLTFLLIFTGFGIFVGLVAPLILLVEGGQALRARNYQRCGAVALALAAIGASWALFAHGYHFNPAVPGYHFPYERPREYFYFVSLMLANFYGVPGYGAATIALGLGIFTILVVLCLWHGWRFVRRGVEGERSSVVIFCLAAYALIYCVNTAAGRVFLGWEQASVASRYVTLMIPAGLAIFLHFATLPSPRWASRLGLAYALLLVPGTTALRKDDWNTIRWYHDGRKAWKAAYLATHDETKADQIANFKIYPAPVLSDRLKYLEEHKLNLFNPSAQP